MSSQDQSSLKVEDLDQSGNAPWIRPKTLTKSEWPPDYTNAIGWRDTQLMWFEKNPWMIDGALEFYKENPIDFINDWVDTFDPRNAMIELPTRMPFIMFERQAQMITFLQSCLLGEQNGLIDKSRDMGATWIACAFSVWLWRFHPGASIGWGSRKELLVDKLGDPDSIFEKLRMILKGLPKCFLPRGFSPDKHMAYMRLINPENDATITGESGDNIGRGGRKLIYFKDESAHYEHPESIEAALGDNTRVQIDISTPNGVGTVYDRKKQSGVEWTTDGLIEKGKTRIFVLDWSDHPTKTQQWHDLREKSAKEAGLLHVFRQEVDRDAASSVQGVIIPAEWVRAAIDAHVALGFDDSGLWSGALDVADEGGDLNALTFRKGVVLHYAEDWGEGDVGQTTRRVIAAAQGKAPVAIQYDAVGIGAGVKSEANRLLRDKLMPHSVTFSPWLAGATVLKPDERVIPGDSNSPTNKDFYANLKAQAWWSFRRRFEKVYRMRNEGLKFPVSELISISSKLPKLRQIERELSQPTIAHDGRLRLTVDKKPDGARSPNLADSAMMNFFPVKVPMVISQEVLQRARMEVRR